MSLKCLVTHRQISDCGLTTLQTEVLLPATAGACYITHDSPIIHVQYGKCKDIFNRTLPFRLDDNFAVPRNIFQRCDRSLVLRHGTWK